MHMHMLHVLHVLPMVRLTDIAQPGSDRLHSEAGLGHAQRPQGVEEGGRQASGKESEDALSSAISLGGSVPSSLLAFSGPHTPTVVSIFAFKSV